MKFHGQPQEGPTRLLGLELDSAPDVPGIYAWYAKVPLREADAAARVNSAGVDLAKSDLDRTLLQFARTHMLKPIDLSGAGAYGLKWNGTLVRESASDSNGEASKLEDRTAKVATQSDSRRILIRLLSSAAPVFASPLYIGVATNLRSRLTEHRDDYDKAIEELRRQPEAADHMRFHGLKFGARLAASGVRLDSVECWVMPATDSLEDSSLEALREASETAEWVLQRVFQPVMGRR